MMQIKLVKKTEVVIPLKRLNNFWKNLNIPLINCEVELILTCYQKIRDVILNRAKYYYENDKERLREQAKNKYRNLSEEEKNKKREYGKNRYRNMFEEKKKRLTEYQKFFRNIIVRQKITNVINKIIRTVA